MLKPPTSQRAKIVFACVLIRPITTLFLLVFVEIRIANFGFNALCYEQTSPLGVYTYTFGYPLRVQFVRSERFFLSPPSGEGNVR